MRNAEWPCHVSFIGIISLVICWKCKLSSQLFTYTFHQLGLLTLQRCLRIRALGSPWIVSSHPHNDWWYTRASLQESLQWRRPESGFLPPSVQVRDVLPAEGSACL